MRELTSDWPGGPIGSIGWWRYVESGSLQSLSLEHLELIAAVLAPRNPKPVFISLAKLAGFDRQAEELLQLIEEAS